MRRLEPRPDLRHARRIVEDASWLSVHHSHAQAARRLAEVLQAVEQHLAEVEQALRAARLAKVPPTPWQLAEIRRDHLRLLHLVEAALAYNSRSEPVRCKACLRKLARSLDRHERRDEELLGRLARPDPDPSRPGA